MKALLLWIVLASAAAQTPPPARRPAPPKPAPGAASYRELKFPPLPAIRNPKTETATLANGMKLILVEDHELPVLEGVALVRTGNLFDPPDKIGLATVTGILLGTGGTLAKTGDAVQEELDNMAASVVSEIGESSGSIRFTAMKTNADAVLAIFKEVLTAPAFRQDKLDHARARLHTVVAQRNDNAQGIAFRELISAVYGKGNPYGWPVEHTPIDRINRADVQAFYRRYFFPANVTLGISGDFDTAAMKANLEKLFADWTVKQDPVPEFPKLGPAPEAGLYVAEKTATTPPVFMMGERGCEYRDKDYPALAVMSRILGGNSQSRLAQRLAAKVGNGFPASASWGAAYDHPGLFTISGTVRPLHLADTLATIREEIERLRTSEVTEAELKTAKDNILNGIIFSMDTRAKMLNAILVAEYFGYPKDFVQQYQNGVAAVTRADVMRVAKERIDAQKLITIFVGNTLDFGPGVDSLGLKQTPINLEIPPSEGKPSATDAAGLQKAKQILSRAQQAMGGADRLAAFKDLTQVDRRSPVAGGASFQGTIRWLAPSYIREDLDGGAQKAALYSDGKTGWISSQQGFFGLPAAQIKQTQGDAFRVLFSLVLSDRIDGRTVYALDDTTVEISDKSGTMVQLVVDPQTGLPAKLLYQIPDPGSGTNTFAEDDLSDFRDVSGIRLPYRIAEMRNGQKTADVTVTEIKLNSGLKVQDLNKRP